MWVCSQEENQSQHVSGDRNHMGGCAQLVRLYQERRAGCLASHSGEQGLGRGGRTHCRGRKNVGSENATEENP